MTVIAWDGIVLAADKMANMAEYAGTVTKIRRATNGALMAFSGTAPVGAELMAWYDAGAKPSAYPENACDDGCWAYLLVITPEREILRFERTAYPVRVEGRFTAMGCGAHFALATMHLGHDAVEAVRVASELSPNCGNGIDQLHHAITNKAATFPSAPDSTKWRST